jgi:putative acetyltransferase
MEENNQKQEMKQIETKRLLLRGWCFDDAEDLFDYASNPNVGPHGGWKPHETVEESKDIIRDLFLDKYSCWAIVERSSGKVIGSIGFEQDTKRNVPTCMELGYALAEEHWGKGFMTEAVEAAIRYGFSELELSMIAIYRDPRNQRSGRVIDKSGFTYEGTLRRAHTVYNGEVRDVACYSMTREEHR